MGLLAVSNCTGITRRVYLTGKHRMPFITFRVRVIPITAFVDPAGSTTTAGTGKENTAPRHHSRDKPFTASRKPKTAMNGQHDDTHTSGSGLRDSNTTYAAKYGYANRSSDGLATPPSNKERNANIYTSPEALFDSPLRSNAGVVRRAGEEDSTLFLNESSSDYMQQHVRHPHQYDSRMSISAPGDADTPLLLLDTSSSKLTSDFSSIQDGGYHEGYWKAKYLRR